MGEAKRNPSKIPQLFVLFAYFCRALMGYAYRFTHPTKPNTSHKLEQTKTNAIHLRHSLCYIYGHFFCAIFRALLKIQLTKQNKARVKNFDAHMFDM